MMPWSNWLPWRFLIRRVARAHGRSSGWFYNRHTVCCCAGLLAHHPSLHGDTAELGLVNRMGVLLRWRRHAERVGQLLFGADYAVPATTAAWRPWPAEVDNRRLRHEANSLDLMALLLEAPGIHSPGQEFEALLAGSGRLKEEGA